MGGTFSRAPPCTSEELLVAALRKDVAGLQKLLRCASPEVLAVTEPLSLYHAAALAGSAEAVRLLSAAGVPIAAAEHVVGLDVPPYSPTWQVLGVTFTGRHAKPFLSRSCSALAIAVSLGPADVVFALLKAGARPQRGDLDMLGALMAAFRQHTYTSVESAAVVQQLLAAGLSTAHYSTMGLSSVAAKQPAAAALLLSAMQQACLAGGQALLDVRSQLVYAAYAAAVLDNTAALEVFAVHMPDLAQSERSAPATCLSLAAQHGGLSVLRLAMQAAALPAAQRTTATARLLGPVFAPMMRRMLNQAAIGNQPAVVQLLMGAGQPATHEDVLRAAQHASAQALPLLLSAGPQPAPASDPIERLELFWRLGCHYTCPILAALETRARTERDSSVEPLDASLLSVLEQLLAAGYRPAVFHDVEVHTHRQLAPVRRAVFEPLSDDPRLDVAGTNRWLALAIEHPAWSPAQHARFLPSFRAATRTLLLVLHRTSRTGSGSSSLASLLASLPNDPLLHIIGLAAYPLSTWAALDACDG